MPRGRNAPKDCPPPPDASTVTVPSGRLPHRRVISEPRMVPNVRSTLETSICTVLGFLLFSVFSNAGSSTRISAVFSSSKSYTASGSKWTCRSPPSPRRLSSTTVPRCGPVTLSRRFKRLRRPTSSSTVRTPRRAMMPRSSSATNSMKFMTYSGFPRKRQRSAGFCVATPTGQVSRLHTRIMTQPIEMSGAVAKPNSSAPRIAATATSRPVSSLPSVSRMTRSRRPFSMSVRWVSARPSSHGRPALWMELRGAAPVPPS